MASVAEIQTEALDRAVNGQSLSNYGAIFEGFMAKGIPEDEIKPRENVFTYNAWKKLGRQVCKGQHGVKVTTWREAIDEETGKLKRFPKSATVFHVSQTKAAGEAEPQPEPAPIPDNPEFKPGLEDPGVYAEVMGEPDPEAEPEAPAADEGTMTLATPGGGSLTFAYETVTPDPEPCPHTQRKIEPGMPCVACGATVHEEG